MSEMNKDISTQSMWPKAIELLHKGEFDRLIDLIETKGPLAKGSKWDRLLGRKFKENESFAYFILHACLTDRLKPQNYKSLGVPDYEEDLIGEIKELIIILMELESLKSEPFEKVFAQLVLKVYQDIGKALAGNSNDYPTNSINAGDWFSAAVLKGWSQVLANYFERKDQGENQLEAMLIECNMTLGYMSHYHYMVGRSMINTAKQLVKLGHHERATQFFKAVVDDFTPFISELMEDFESEPEGVDFEEIVPTESLIEALEGLQNLNEPIDTALLESLKPFLILLKENEETDTTEDPQ